MFQGQFQSQSASLCQDYDLRFGYTRPTDTNMGPRVNQCQLSQLPKDCHQPECGGITIQWQDLGK